MKLNDSQKSDLFSAGIGVGVAFLLITFIVVAGIVIIKVTGCS